MAADNKKFPNSDIPIRKSSDLLPNVFQTPANDKFLSGVLDPLIQPGVVDKTVGYIGKRYGKTFKGKDVYLDTDQTLRSRYQLELTKLQSRNITVGILLLYGTSLLTIENIIGSQEVRHQ